MGAQQEGTREDVMFADGYGILGVAIAQGNLQTTGYTGATGVCGTISVCR